MGGTQVSPNTNKNKLKQLKYKVIEHIQEGFKKLCGGGGAVIQICPILGGGTQIYPILGERDAQILPLKIEKPPPPVIFFEQCLKKFFIDHVTVMITEAECPESWPSSGEIDFDNVSLRYDVCLEPVIQGMNLHIPAGHKVHTSTMLSITFPISVLLFGHWPYWA